MATSEFYMIRPSIAVEIGEAEAAILEKIAVYCRGKASNLKGEEGKWIYNSVSSWKIQHFQHWSESKIYRGIKSLEEQGLIRSKKANFRGRQNIRWYRVEEKGYKLLNDSIEKRKSVKNNYINSEGIDLDEFQISREELERDIEPTHSKQAERINYIEIQNIRQKKVIESLIHQNDNNSRQIAKMYYIAENTAEKASSKGVEEEKYFELGKKHEEKQKEEISYEKEKIKKIKDLNEFIEEEVERRVREINRAELEREVAEEMERLYKEYERAHENDGAIIQNGFNFTELFNILKKTKSRVSDNKRETELEARTGSLINSNSAISTKSQEIAQSAVNKATLPTQASSATTLEDQKATVQTMVELWNKVFEYSVNPIKAYSNKKNQQALLNLYRTIFNSDLDNWREYALKVNSSQFLMGEKTTKSSFKAVFSWLIKEETIEKILHGEYGVGDRELDINNKSKNLKIKKEAKVTELENRAVSHLKESLNEIKEEEEYRSYIEEENYEEDGDKYKLGLVLRHIPKRNFLYSDEYKLMRERLFGSYLMKKHTDQSRLEIRDKLRNAINHQSKEIEWSKSREIGEQGEYLYKNVNNLFIGRADATQ